MSEERTTGLERPTNDTTVQNLLYLEVAMADTERVQVANSLTELAEQWADLSLSNGPVLVDVGE